MGDEGQRHDSGRNGLATDDQGQPCAVGGKVPADIAHGDRRRSRVGPKPPEVTTPASVPSSAMIVGLRSGRRASVRADADAAADRAVVELIAHHQAAGKIPVHLAAFADDPGQAGLDRAGELVDVVAVEAKPGLQPQRVAGAEADGDDLRLLRSACPPALPPVRRERKFRSRPRRCSRSGTPGSRCRQRSGSDAHERQRGGSGDRRAMTAAAVGSLQRQQRAVFHAVSGVTPCRQVGREVGKIDVLAAGVDDQEQAVFVQAGDHQVVDDAAGLVGAAACSAGGRASDRRCRRAPVFPARPRHRFRSALPGPCGRRRTDRHARGVCRCSAMTPPLQREARSPVKSYCTGMA